MMHRVSLMRVKALSYGGLDKPHIFKDSWGQWSYLAPATIHPAITHAEHKRRVQLIAYALAFCRTKNGRL